MSEFDRQAAHSARLAITPGWWQYAQQSVAALEAMLCKTYTGLRAAGLARETTGLPAGTPDSGNNDEKLGWKMKLNCKVGDLAVVVRSTLGNVGKIVRVVRNAVVM